MHRVLLPIIVCLGLLSGPVPAADCDGCDRSLAPRLWIPDGDPALDQLPLKSSHAEIRIDGPIAQVRVTQRYGNAGTRPINARYVFPGSTRAAVHGLTMRIGERVIWAEIKEKGEAARTFQEAAAQGKRTALLDQQRPNVFAMDVANIMPGDALELTLDYSELLTPEQGVYELVYPTVVGPRYGGDPLRDPGAETSQGQSDAKWIGNPYAQTDQEGRNPAAIATGITVTLASPVPIRDLRVVQHKVTTRWDSDRAAHVALDPAETEAGNRDFVLRFRLAGDQVLSGLMTYTREAEHYFLLMAQPPQRVAPAQIMRREFLFVVDVSGSMNGFPLQTAGALMARLLAGLRPQETFNILFFSGGSDVLSPTPLAATPENIRHAVAVLNSRQGGGGTELGAALERAFAMPRTPDLARSVVVVTDGFISAERGVYDLIRLNLNDSNLFAFGIGSSVNRFLIESMAQAGAGEPFVVTDSAAALEVGERFRRYVDAPLLSGIRVQGQGVELYDLEPREIPVMLAERPIVVLGKYRAAGPDARLEVTGRTAEGEYSTALPLAEATSGEDAGLLPVLWARQRLVRLSDQAGEGVEANRDAILSLGLRYGLLTRYTSFVGVDEVIANPQGGARTVQQPLPLPQGVSALALAPNPMPEPEAVWLALLLFLVPFLNRVLNRGLNRKGPAAAGSARGLRHGRC
ncbi:VIT domain-containing protein [Candidatus Thiodictyon syntrophicum]|uniref:Trypsin n=1 Tax=Candidatus Thiodictyon syntrophicum TaxID=1166950 RepID=A0A2K8UFZ5_9GAMM|nr:VIT domain-containing protein [Candidatus Thiodictyon syntrophicum]AUB84486.1 trypsin [Candidatus Thiodictyon syntrophicum]